jgi:hypothetical protein
LVPRNVEVSFVAWFSGGKQTVTLDKLDLSFLGNDSYDAVCLSSDGPSKFARREPQGVNASTALSVFLDSGDGFVARFERAIKKGR